MTLRFLEPTHGCPSCRDGGEIASHEETTTFPYGIDEDAVELKATLTVFECLRCREEFLTSEAETVKELAVYKHRLRMAETQLEKEKRDARRTILIMLAMLAILIIGDLNRG